MNNEKVEKEDVKKEALEGFKMWLDDVGIGSENFDEEIYDTVLLLSLYQNYQFQVEQYMRMQEAEENKKGSKLFVPEDAVDKKKKGNGKIIRPDFGNK
jgi:hypothetical protein